MNEQGIFRVKENDKKLDEAFYKILKNEYLPDIKKELGKNASEKDINDCFIFIWKKKCENGEVEQMKNEYKKNMLINNFSNMTLGKN